MQSLRKRAWIGGSLSAIAAVAIGSLLLYSYLDRKTLEQFDRSLIERHTQIVVALSNFADDPERLDELILDPAYDRAASGRYWQIVGPRGEINTSPSLFDATLPAQGGGTRLTMYDADGVDAEPLRIAHQLITLEDGTEWSVAVAESLVGLVADRAEARRSLLLAFALVAAIGLTGTLLQTAVILRPLEKLRQDVARRWEQDEILNSTDYPEEVAPLVSDINTLLQRNREIVGRSRRQAADLAHALKTPSTILRNELELLATKSHDLQKAVDALDRLDAQLARSLARIRLSNTAEVGFSRTDVSSTVTRFARLFDKMAEKDGKHVAVSCEPDLFIRFDPQDFEEILGNVLDNALKWSRRSIALSAVRRSGGVDLVIEDDGQGIKGQDRAEALKSGSRLDTSKPGSGLGLAIATDLLKAYGGSLELGDSQTLGGLAVRIHLPTGTFSTA